MSKQAGAVEREFAALYDATHPKLLSYCLRRTATRADALDAAAETYVVAWRRFDDLPPQPEALPWLFAVARRVLANQRRGQGRLAALVARLPAAVGSAPTPEDAVIDGEERRDVLRALERLSPGDRELLRLSAWEGLSPRQLAAACDCTESAAKVRLHRARRRLAREYDRVRRPWAAARLRAAGGSPDG